VEGFRVEQGEVLLSVQLILTREEEWRRVEARAAAAGVNTGGVRPAVARSVQAAVSARPPAPASRPPHLRPAPARPAVRPVSSAPKAPVGTGTSPTNGLLMVDPLTGVGTLHALRRDLMLQQAWPGAGKPVSVLVALQIDGLDQIRLAMGAAAGDYVVKSLVEVAPFALRAQDRVYRSGRNQLTLMLPAADEVGAEGARRELEAALQRCLTGRGYPEVRLTARKLDAVALAS